MSLAVLEINDSGIRLSVDREIVSDSPGFAVLDGDRLLIGKEGMQNSRLLPSWTNNRFWNQLSTDAIPNGAAGIRHNADLAFAHLKSFWETSAKGIDQVILIVPGYFSNEQLRLLLGITRECEIPVVSLVDTSLISVCNNPLGEVVLHLDATLHRITLTLLNANLQLSRKETITVVESGIFTFWERWANVIANQFIQTSRYDPMHQAISEQNLFDKIPKWLDDLDSGGSHTFTLDLADASYTTNISSDQLITACSSIYPKIVQSIRSLLQEQKTAQLFISHRLKAMPGLKDSLALIKNISFHQLGETELLDAAYQYSKELIDNGSAASEGISHIVKLPVFHSLNATASESPPFAGDNNHNKTGPTHLLLNDQAMSIGKVFRLSSDLAAGLKQDQDPVCTIYTQGQDLLLENHGGEKLTLNGNQVERTSTVKTGDVMQIGSSQIRFISVVG